MQTENKKGFQVKDLIVTALLSLCALVIYILCAFLSFSPYTMLVVSPLWSLLAAITYFLVAAKTKKPWTLFIFCAITGIYGFYPPMIICCIIAGIISALIAWKTGCTNGKTLTISYIIYMVLAAFSGTYIPFLFFSNQTLEQYAGMFGESYLGILQTLVSPVTAIIMLVVVAICAFVGALNAKKLLKKHFKKAGMEDYLEAVLVLQQQKGYVRCVDVAELLDVKKPSVRRAVKELSKKKCLIKKDDGTLSLTEQGQQIAQQIYEKHQFFTKRLVEAGVPQDIAAQDACKLEYVISEISFKKLKEAVWINDREVIPSEK